MNETAATSQCTPTYPGNPEHEHLFAIPEPTPSPSTGLVVPSLPEPEPVTGDRDVDTMLWLRHVCKTARDPITLELAMEAAEQITTPAKALEDRYAAWLHQQAAHPFQVAFATIGLADIKHHVAAARERIKVHNEGLAVFGSYHQALAPTPAEQMLERTAGTLPDKPVWELEDSELGPVFTDCINPTTLTEAAAELRYWSWIGTVRWKMRETEAPGSFDGDEGDLLTARRWWVESLLTRLAPQEHGEVAHLVNEIDTGLIDIGSTDDGDKRANVYKHLLRCLISGSN